MGDGLEVVDIPGEVTTLHSGFNHVCVTDTLWRLFCFGNNDNGQLGYGDSENRGDDPGEMGVDLEAVDLGDGVRIMDVAAGAFHTLIVSDQGKVKAWGRNLEGQLGYGDKQARGDDFYEMSDNLSFVDLCQNSFVDHVIATELSSCALQNDGLMRCWGDNKFGQLGQGGTNNTGDKPNEMGSYLTFIPLPSGVAIKLMISGWRHLGVLSTENILYLWGKNDAG